MDRFLDVNLLRVPFENHENSLEDLGDLIIKLLPIFNTLENKIKDQLLDALIMTDLDTILQWIKENKEDSPTWNQFEEQVVDKNYRFILQLSEKMNSVLKIT